MEEAHAYNLRYEVDSIKRQLTQQFPISEPTTRQIFLRILTLIDNILEDHCDREEA